MKPQWTIQTLGSVVDQELNDLPVDVRARFQRICDLIRAVGLEHVGMPHVRPIEPPLWEMRLSGRDGIARALYVAARGKRVIVLRVFAKKTQATPRHEVDLALKRAKQLDTH